MAMNEATRREKEFLRHIGEHANPQALCDKHGRALSKMELLKKYLKASLSRVNWGEIDKNHVLEYTKDMIKKLDRPEPVTGLA